MKNISGKNTLIIGGSGGIGASICKELAKANCTLFVHGSRESTKFDQLIAELNTITSATPIVQKLEVGFANNFSKTPLIKAIESADIICICFGPFLQKKLHEMDIDSWAQMYELNAMLPSIVVSAALPSMMDKKWGRLLLFGGTRTDRVNAFATNAAYASAKTAVSTLVRSTALDYAKYGITCNALFPGFTKTEYMADDLCDFLCKKMPQNRLIEAREVARMAVNLLENPMMNGSLVSIDGGWDPAFF